jgi:hypothetical protein
MVTQDSRLATSFGEISKEFGIFAQRTNSGTSGIPPELGASKYEALLLDFETVPYTKPILTRLRQSPANRNAVIFAVVGDANSRQRAREEGATFFLQRPLDGSETRRVLQAAYGLMTRERRRYFRCAAELPVRLVRDSGEEIACTTINISSNGMAVSSSASLEPGEKLHVELTVPGLASPVRAQGTIVWDDKHGKTGLSVEPTHPRMQMELDAWLDTNFSQVLKKAN